MAKRSNSQSGIGVNDNSGGTTSMANGNGGLSKKAIDEFTNCVCAGVPAIYIRTYEGERAIKQLPLRMVTESQYTPASWDCIRGLCVGMGASQMFFPAVGPLDPLNWLSGKELIVDAPDGMASPPKPPKASENTILFLWNYHPYMCKDSGCGSGGIPETTQTILDNIGEWKAKGKTIVVVSPLLHLPVELEKVFTVIDFPLPDSAELERILSAFIEDVKVNFEGSTSTAFKKPEGAELREILRAMTGMTEFEAETALSLSMVKNRKFVPEDIAALKTQFVKKCDILDISRDDVTMEDVCGLDNLKKFTLKVGRSDLSKGVLLLGVPGCGKSMYSKALGRALGIPTIGLDFGKVYGHFVGDSEGNVRNALSVVDAMAPCLPGDARISMADGSVCTISTLYDTCNKGAHHSVWSFSLDNLRVQRNAVSAVTRRVYNGSMFDITTNHGRVQATNRHPLPVMGDGGIQWMPAQDVKVGDWMAIPRTLPNVDRRICLWDYLPNNVRIYLTENIFSKYKSCVKRNEYATRKYHRSYYIKLGEIRSRPELEIPAEYEILEWKTGGGGYQDSTIEHIPKYIDDDFAYMMGLLFGDGYYTKRRVGLSNTCQTLHDNFGRIAVAKFGCSIAITAPTRKTGTPCWQTYFDSAIVARLLRDVEKCALQLSPTQTLAWLRGIGDAEGYVDKRGGRIDISALRKTGTGETNDLVRDILLRAGYHVPKGGSTYGCCHITLCAKDAVRFASEVGFTHPKKAALLKTIGVGTASRADRYPIGPMIRVARLSAGAPLRTISGVHGTGGLYEHEHSLHVPSRETADKYISAMRTEHIDCSKITPYLDGDVMWSQVVTVTHSPFEGYVYDLQVEGAHNFVANRHFVHNCVLRVEEIEKALSGVASSHMTDGGTGARVGATFLNWAEDHKGRVILVGTCNDISKIPPEYLRAERWDAIFFVDLPNATESKALVDLYSERYNVPATDMPVIDNYTGAEIKSLFRIASMLGTGPKEAANYVVPLIRSMEAEIQNLRTWAAGKTVPASTGGAMLDGSGPKPSKRGTSQNDMEVG